MEFHPALYFFGLIFSRRGLAQTVRVCDLDMHCAFSAQT
jgi:hypothetical protein